MPKKYRLSHADFTRLPRAGAHRMHGRYFSLTIYHLAEGAGAKMASVVSKKIAARAVGRNRIERRCREALRPHMPRIRKSLAPPAAGLALVFHGKREATSASFEEMKKDIEALLARGGL